MQNSMNNVHLGTQDSMPTFWSPYLCRQLHPPSSGRIFREKNKMNYLMPNDIALQRTKRKENTVHLFLKKVYLLFRLTFFLPFLLKKKKQHIILEPPRWSRSTVSHPPADDIRELRTAQKSRYSQTLERKQKQADWGQKSELDE